MRYTSRFALYKSGDRTIQTKEYKAIFVLWLGYPRKQGDKNDCYKAFTKMVERGNFPNSLDALILDSQED
ncbi:type II toxin-antitoxin system YhaV family toxin [Microcystis aeruginosa CS-555/01A07]|uniref:type II toxin-antitoxin system YhaV family toxin n=1 Tax=Microcystis TaxID=1125 RepID=UPI0022C5763C|nr:MULTISPECIES: type II toxin-antitoxin system YhaV family toxin [Microcystis]MCZ8024616.1 type II toxin-antitoxin system YhaV family toxin [Microcystis sp. LE19-10.1B]MCZ8361510.1 type II toxin-antitoxin system YhaV family toxin [Microcystis sp. LE19-251.1A]MDB9413780.1 type II toxin-antitoxin system YhaV family toxin [Microcystis aeruginosa CS-567/02]MDB9431297.1 type II toxin-antitoxin system YhaV family toxin [Microcystis aeruginosa CS-555/01A07]